MNELSQDQARPGQSSAGDDSPASLDDVAAMLAERRSLKRPTEPTQQATKAAPEGPSIEQSEEAQAVESAPETDEAQKSSDGDQPEAEEGDGDAYFELDGEQVSLSQVREWKAGGMRDADYRRKTQALAEKSRAMHQLEESLTQQNFVRMREIDEADKVLERRMSQFSDIDFYAIAQENPARAAALREQREAIKEQRQQLHTNRQRYADEWKQLTEQNLKMRAEAALPEIKSRIPGWSESLYAELSQHVVSRGGEPDVVSRIVEPWFWELVNDAMAMRKGKSMPMRKAVPLSPTKTVNASGKKPGRMSAESQAIHDARKATSIRSQEAAVLSALRARRSR